MPISTRDFKFHCLLYIFGVLEGIKKKRERKIIKSLLSFNEIIQVFDIISNLIQIFHETLKEKKIQYLIKFKFEFSIKNGEKK